MNKKNLKRFIDKIDFTNSCWFWKAGKFKNGYGQFWLNDGNGFGQKYAHRVSYAWFVGPLIPMMDIDHICSNKNCVNPNHLNMITRSEHLFREADRGLHWNTAKTHCKHGHELTGDNLYTCGRHRTCKTCRNKRVKEFKRKQRLVDKVVA